MSLKVKDFLNFYGFLEIQGKNVMLPLFGGSLMNTKMKEGARNKGNTFFLRIPWNKGGLVNMGPGAGFTKGLRLSLDLG